MNGSSLDQAVATLAGWLRDATRGVAFTGAGISTESGIPDFRSPGGVWSRHRPVMYQDFLADPAERCRYWQIRKESIPGFLAARPNAGHLALAKLEAQGRLRAVITQNIDELHQRAGSRRVLEIHGTAMRVHCLACDKRWTCEQIQARLDAGEEEITCDACGGLVKSMTVSFGQELPADVWQESMQLCRSCDVFLALGSSLVVYPAAQLPEAARQHGAKLIIINRDPTPMDESADLVIHASIGETLGAAMQALETV
ncbi:MAG: NAD-dependent deacetylase [Phycisphaerae bacterium]